MRVKNQFAAFALLLVASFPSMAALQSLDWKTAGDNLVTLDTATGKEWLDLSRTDNMSYSQVQGLLSTTFSGWRFPTAAEVHTMMSNQFPQVANYSESAYGLTTNTREGAGWEMSSGKTFREHFGSTYTYWMGTQDWHIVSYGFFKNENDSILLSGFNRRNYWNGSYHQLYHNSVVTTSIPDTYTNTYSGWYLVNDGGVSLSSINNPTLNGNNPDAPINQPPGGAVSLADLVVGTTYATATLDYVTSGVSGMLGYKYRINGGPEQTSTGNVISLTGLSSNTDYVLEYAAYNDKGTGTWSSTSLKTTAVSSETPLIGLLGGVMLLALRRRQIK